MSERLTYRVDEFAAAVGVSRSKAYELIRSGEVPSIRLGHSLRVPVDALRRAINERAAAGQGDGSKERTGNVHSTLSPR